MRSQRLDNDDCSSLMQMSQNLDNIMNETIDIDINHNIDIEAKTHKLATTNNNTQEKNENLETNSLKITNSLLTQSCHRK